MNFTVAVFIQHLYSDGDASHMRRSSVLTHTDGHLESVTSSSIHALHQRPPYDILLKWDKYQAVSRNVVEKGARF